MFDVTNFLKGHTFINKKLVLGALTLCPNSLNKILSGHLVRHIHSSDNYMSYPLSCQLGAFTSETSMICLKLSTRSPFIGSPKYNIVVPFIIHAGNKELTLKIYFKCFEILSCD